MSRAGSPSQRAKAAKPKKQKGGWKHINSVLYEKRGIVLAEGERVVAGLTIPDTARRTR